MKNLSKLALSALCITLASFNSSAQEIYPDGIKDVHDKDAAGNQRVYSQAQSLTEKLPLDLIAVNEPQEFEGLPVNNMEGVEIGTVLAIARKKSDQSLHAILRTSAGVSTAIRLNELTLGALAYWDPAGALGNQPFQEANFEPISQYQTGHTAWGSLTNPAVAGTQAQSDEQTSPVDTATAADLAVQADAASRSDDPTPTNPVYQPTGSSIVQLALNRPDAFYQKPLHGERGETLGQIDYLARNLQDQQLYAVVTRFDGNSQAAVKLDALTLGKLLVHETHAEVQRFDEDEFETVGKR